MKLALLTLLILASCGSFNSGNKGVEAQPERVEIVISGTTRHDVHIYQHADMGNMNDNAILGNLPI